MVDSIETNAGESIGTRAQTKISEIISNRILDRKLDKIN